MVILEHGPFRVVRIDAEMVDAALPLVRPLLERAVARTAGFRTVDSLVDELRQGVRPWLLWAVLDGETTAGAFVVSIQRVGDDLVGTFEILAGIAAADWIGPLVARFECYLAGMYGVSVLRIVGRRGWERAMAPHGYRASHWIAERRLPPVAAGEVGFLPHGAQPGAPGAALDADPALSP